MPHHCSTTIRVLVRQHIHAERPLILAQQIPVINSDQYVRPILLNTMDRIHQTKRQSTSHLYIRISVGHTSLSTVKGATKAIREILYSTGATAIRPITMATLIMLTS